MSSVANSQQARRASVNPESSSPTPEAPRNRLAGVAAFSRKALLVTGQYTLALLLVTILVAYLSRLDRGDLRIPYRYEGDGLMINTWCKAVVDHGWYMHNPNLGAPGGQFMEDYPLVDSFNFGIMKFFSLFTHNAQIVLNLFCFSTFLMTTVTSLFVLRHFRISYPVALACSLLFSMLPYHFYRLSGHHFLGCYQMIPLSSMLALWIYQGRLSLNWRKSKATADAKSAAKSDANRPAGQTTRRIDAAPSTGSKKTAGAGDAATEHPSSIWRWLAAIVICLLQASSGAYFAFFAEYFIAVAGVAAALQRRSLRPLLTTALLVSITFAGFLAHLIPSYLFWAKNGKNPLVGTRIARETELYGYKLSASLLPIPEHRIKMLSDLRTKYEQQTLNSNEGSWAAEGVVASIGTLVLLGLLMIRKTDSQLLGGLSILNIFGILLGTIGGFSMIFNLLVTARSAAITASASFCRFLR